MIKFPNAKINIGLNIVSKRNDGYHNLETIFYPIGLKDALEFVVSADHKDTLQSSGVVVDGASENNLVMKALKLIRSKYDIPPLDIYLHKVIPFGAGLGGGSSDAAAMLLMLNDQFTLNITKEELMGFASQLGADCAFFIQNKPQFATGIGDVFEDIEISLAGYYFVLLKPAISVSTPEAYSLVKPHQPEISIKDQILLPIEEWQRHIRNDFEVNVFAKYPEIGMIKDRLIEYGALYASMSGSGSSVFGIFETKPELDKSIFENCFFWETRLD